MNPIYYLLIPLSIMATILGIHYFFLWWAWRKELRRDKEKKAIVDRILSDDPACENEEVLHPSKWESFSKA